MGGNGNWRSGHWRPPMADASTVRRLVANCHGINVRSGLPAPPIVLKGKKRPRRAPGLPSTHLGVIENSVSANLIPSHSAAPAVPNDPAIGGVRRACLCVGGMLGADERRAEQDARSRCDVVPPHVVATSAGAFAPALVTHHCRRARPRRRIPSPCIGACIFLPPRMVGCRASEWPWC